MDDEAKRKLMTDDARLIRQGPVVATDADQQMLDLSGPFFTIDADGLRLLVGEAVRLHAMFRELAVAIMTAERARFVRRLRCEEDYTWRAVAWQCHVEWKGCWAPPSNQLMGMALCEAAAAVLGENAYDEPWN